MRIPGAPVHLGVVAVTGELTKWAALPVRGVKGALCKGYIVH